MPELAGSLVFASAGGPLVFRSREKFNSRQQPLSQPLAELRLRLSRGGWTRLELFLRGIADWDYSLRRRMDDRKSKQN
jgi:hypothetical protein